MGASPCLAIIVERRAQLAWGGNLVQEGGGGSGVPRMLVAYLGPVRTGLYHVLPYSAYDTSLCYYSHLSGL